MLPPAGVLLLPIPHPFRLSRLLINPLIYFFNALIFIIMSILERTGFVGRVFSFIVGLAMLLFYAAIVVVIFGRLIFVVLKNLV